jgi:DNA-binding NarL/FixJ family response regulator
MAVLVVDDRADLRTLIRMSLELDGRFRVVGEAATGVEALDVAASARPDAVIIDLAMPELDGLAAIPALRAAHPAVTIVVLSGFDGRHFADDALGRGADAYVEKGEPLEAVADLLCRLRQSLP